MTKTFIFQTGHGKGLAKAEIQAVLGDCVVDEVYDGIVVQTELEDPLKVQDQMGGVVRITEVLQKGPASMPLNFEEWVCKAIKEGVNASGKIRYGLSVHPKSEKILKKCLIGSKKKLKKELGNMRFANKDFQNLSSVQAWHENLLKPGAIELHLFKGETHWYLSRTLSIQNFEWYAKRDMERPARSAKNGMFPPKLAQILINLAQPEGTVFDPFCGSGTVLQEALLMGHEAVGSDLSEQMVKDTQANLEWLTEQQKLPHFEVFHADANKLTEIPGTIVTETWLGPPMENPPTDLERPKLQREIEALYESFFSNLKKILKSPTTVVFTAAYYKNKNERHFLPNLPAILEKYTEIIPLSDHERPSLFYERKNQVVGREIWKVVVG